MAANDSFDIQFTDVPLDWPSEEHVYTATELGLAEGHWPSIIAMPLVDQPGTMSFWRAGPVPFERGGGSVEYRTKDWMPVFIMTVLNK